MPGLRHRLGLLLGVAGASGDEVLLPRHAGTLQVVRFYVPAIGPISLLGAWL